VAKTKELKKRSWGQESIVFVRFGSRLPCERLSFQRGLRPRYVQIRFTNLRPGTVTNVGSPHGCGRDEICTAALASSSGRESHVHSATTPASSPSKHDDDGSGGGHVHNSPSSSSAVAGAPLGDDRKDPLARCSHDSSLLPYEGVAEAAAVEAAAAPSVPSNLGMASLGFLDLEEEPNMPEMLGMATVGALGSLGAFSPVPDAVEAVASGGGAPAYGLYVIAAKGTCRVGTLVSAHTDRRGAPDDAYCDVFGGWGEPTGL